MTIEITPSEAERALEYTLRAGLVAMLKGPPSTAKSAIVAALAKKYNLKLIDFRLGQCDVTDLLGFPDIDRGKDRARYVPMETFPLEGDPLPVDANGNPMNGWLLFFDELNSADRDVQKGTYKTIEKKIGTRNMHPNVAIVAAGNREEDGAIVEQLSSALKSRVVHFNIRPDHAGWLDYARAEGFDERITSFIEFKPNMLYTFDPETIDTQDTYACYRTWEYTNKLLKQIGDTTNEPLLLPLFAGTLSEGPAREFIAFLRTWGSLPTVPQIVANPDKIPVPKEPGTQYALTGSLGVNANPGNIDPLMVFIKRLPIEFQVITLREIYRRNEAMLQEKAIQDWMRTNGQELH